MNAVCISLPLVKLRQRFENHYPTIKNIIMPENAYTYVYIAGSMAEGLTVRDQYDHLYSSDTDQILIIDTCKVNEDIKEQVDGGALHSTLVRILRLPDFTCAGCANLLIVAKNSTDTELCSFQDAYFLTNNINEIFFNK